MKNVTYINAGAGSGKTYRLTKTLTELIKEKKVKSEQVILTTFTTKAANEFKEKAKAFLFDEGMYEEAVQLDYAMIGTVHSVCQRMIGKYWFNLGLSPNMGVMAEEDTKYYISQSLAELPTEDELKVLHGFAREFAVGEINAYGGMSSKLDYNFWQGHLKSIIDFATNYELDDFAKSEQESLDYVRQFVRAGTTITISNAELDAMLTEARTYVQNSNRIKKKDDYFKSFDEIKRTSWIKSVAWYKSVQKTMDAKYGDTCAAVLDRLANIWVSQEVFDKQEIYIKLLFNLAMRWKENFAQFKRDKNLLDYNDMEKYMRQLMQNEDIASEISQSYRYLFVDEFQDSSPIQVKIFDALSDLMEHSYWVGDYKQAIYGFRGSDIALTKAVVDRVAKKENGCDTDTLDKSWRSLPDIVEVNNAVFEKTFANVLDKENIHLDKVRKNETHEKSLRYFVAGEGAGVAEHILKLLKKGAKPNEIAVLARANATLAAVADNLKEWDIPSSREDYPIIESPVYPLVASLLRIVGSAKDALSKATVAILTESDFTTKHIIEEKILNDADALAKTEAYLADVPLISQLLTIRPRLQQQSVASLVESMVIELNLYDVVKKLSIDPAFGISCLQTIINTARVYEEHGVQMNLPATIDGFLSYMEEVSPVGTGDSNGVQLHTYHSCKGLQWKYVILMSLNTNVADLKKSVKNDIYGVHSIHTQEPSADNPYPDVFIRLTPWIFGSAKNVPEEISARIESSEEFKQAYRAMVAETNRVLYVGMTRPKDVLILNIDVPKRGAKLLQWPKDVGVDTVAESIPDSRNWDVFGTGHLFADFTLSESELDALAPYGKHDKTLEMPLNIEEPTFEKQEPRYISPSRIHAKGEVISCHDFEKRIPFAKQPSDMAIVGDCIHQIFAAIEEPRCGYKIEMNEIICSFGLNGVLVDERAITLAWNNLAEYLTSKHGIATKTYHERPFRMERDGQTIVGSIDLVWQTKEGDILVDFKTCPMAHDVVLDVESDHYVGWYAGQLEAYSEALKAAGEKVIKRYIYYPVNGLLVEVGEVIKQNTYLLRWNPSISDYKLDDYRKTIHNNPDGFGINWSIFEFEKAKKGDKCYMLRTGNINPGIIWRGEFVSAPYDDDDWTGKTGKRMYINLETQEFENPDEPLPVSIDALIDTIPDVNWKKGHSGELLTIEQANKLDELWEEAHPFEYEEGYLEEDFESSFNGYDDADSDLDDGHYYHLQCLDDDVNYITQSFLGIVCNSKNVIGSTDETSINEKNGYSTQVFMLSTDESQDITMRSVFKANEDENELCSFFPYVVNSKKIPMVLKKIEERSDGIEAVLTCEYDGNEFCFFDVDYLIHKGDYVLNETYDFALSAIAYEAYDLDEGEISFILDSDILDNIHDVNPNMLEEDENGNVLPMNVSMEDLIACVQYDEKHPDDAEFWTTIQSKVIKCSLLKRDYYRLEIMIYHDENGKHVVNIPLVARASSFENNLTKGTTIRGTLWLQGRMVIE